MDLQTKIQYLKGVGPKMGAKLNKLGIETIENLLYFYPRRYEDYTQITKIGDLDNSMSNSKYLISNKNPNDQMSNAYTVRARIVGIGNKTTRKRGFTVTEAVVHDGTGSLKVIWFNQPFLAKMLKAGSEVILHGKVAYNFYTHDLTMESPNRANKPKIVPVYAETAGISSYFIARLVSGIMNQVSGIREVLPEKIIEQNKLLGIDEAILNIHQPKDSEMLLRARERIAFDELFLIALRAQLSKVEVESKFAPRIEIKEKLLKDFTKVLPFVLTEDQKKAAWVIIKDMAGITTNSVIARTTKEDEAIYKKDQIARPMNRLLNGDVGSGKTVVATFAAYVAIRAGYRVAMMAPTEILAQQHYKTCCELLSKIGISVGLITSSTKELKNIETKELVGRHCEESSTWQSIVPDETKKVYNNRLPRPRGLAMTDNNLAPRHDSGQAMKQFSNEPSSADLVIGTHALLQDKVDLQNVGLVIVDEQHRFGVKQRAALLKITNFKIQIPNKSQISKSETDNPKKLKSYNLIPHFLSMTATPIPRTLYLALFADLNLSVIKTMPLGRLEIKTRVVDEVNRDKAYQFIRQQIKSGRQAFVICPLIEDKSEKLEARSSKLKALDLFEQERKSVMAEYEKLSKQIFPDLKIGMLHGRMKSKEKEAVMGDFSAGGETSPKGGKATKVDILVSTSVVEVGVDVPNASIMMIEDAERFGLAQLHQFRGRVGRAEHQSYCFLFSSSQNPLAISRLQAMEATNDGFKLAELDLSNRGAGDIFGIMQSGDINLKMASFSDRVIIEKASSSAREIVAEGISKYPPLVEKAKEFEAGRHLE